MRAEELMIGDYVKLKDTKLGNINFVGPVVQIKSITGRHVLVPNAKGLLEDVTEEYLLPVPLTPEILEKNGFEESYYSILTADGYKKLPQYKYKNITQVQDICRNLITISYSDLKGGVYDIQCGIGSHIYDLKYVHQLQHALRLCGIEKEIEL